MNGAYRAGSETSPPLSESLRKLASSAAAACSSMMSVESADTLTHMMSSLIAAHHDSCPYTCDKVVVGKLKYDTLMSSKPPVYFPLCNVLITVSATGVLRLLDHVCGTCCRLIYGCVTVLNSLNGCSRPICLVLETAALCDALSRNAVYK